MKLVEITSLQDNLLLPWLELYEKAFPAAERVLVTRLLLGIKDRAPSRFALAAVDEQDHFLGLVYYSIISGTKVVFLWYFAVLPELRGAGLGAQLYQALLQRLGPECRGVVFDVEMPELCSGQAERDLAQRRIVFYRRLGARLLDGVRYTMQAESHLPALEMHLMAHPLPAAGQPPLTAPEALEAVESFIGERIPITGEVRYA